MAIYGWTRQTQAALYTRSANRRRLSDEGMKRMTEAWADILAVPPGKRPPAPWDTGRGKPCKTIGLIAA